MKNSKYKVKPFDLRGGYYIDDNALFVIECLLKGQYSDGGYGIILGVPAEWTNADFFRFLVTLNEKYPLEFESIELLLSFYDELESGLFPEDPNEDDLIKFLKSDEFKASSATVDRFLTNRIFSIKEVRDILIKGLSTDHISFDELKIILENLKAVHSKGVLGDDLTFLDEFIEVTRTFVNHLNCTVSFKKTTLPKIKTDLNIYMDRFKKDELYGSGTFLLDAGVFKYSSNIYSFKYHKKLLLKELEKGFEFYSHKLFKLNDFVHTHDILKESAEPLRETREVYQNRQFLFTHILKTFELDGAIFVQTYFVNLEDWRAVELGCFLKIKDLKLSPTENNETSIKLTNEGININGKTIKLFSKKEGKEYNFIKIIASDPKRLWSFDEIAENLDMPDYDKKDTLRKYSNRFYQYATSFNKKVAFHTGINDFLDFSKKTVQIKNKYL